MTLQDKASEVKKIPIQNYFDYMIIPQMSGYYSNWHVDFEADPRTLCPLHSEDTPSFRYYDYSNTFYCFGCSQGGDIIQLHRKYLQVNQGLTVPYRDAVEFLYDTFIKGRENGKLLKIKSKSSLDSDRVTSSNIEIIRYNNFKQYLEFRLDKEKIISSDIKLEAYYNLDYTDRLLKKELISVKEALENLEEIQHNLENLENLEET